jgi:hypothetical protein
MSFAFYSLLKNFIWLGFSARMMHALRFPISCITGACSLIQTNAFFFASLFFSLCLNRLKTAKVLVERYGYRVVSSSVKYEGTRELSYLTIQ